MKIIVIQIDDALSSTAEAIIRRLQGLEPEGTPCELGNAEGVPLTVRDKVQALKARCRRAGTQIQTKDVIELADVDESTFFKYQSGSRVSARVRRACEEVLTLSADGFLQKLVGRRTGSRVI